MVAKPIWNSFETFSKFPVLRESLHVDVSIIGAGITGITTAYFLKKAGLKVAVLDAGKIGMGTTGHSTGNLYTIIDQLLSSLDSKYDKEIIQKVLKARDFGFQTIERILRQEDIDCDYTVQPMYLFSNDKADKIEEELGISSRLGVPNLEVSPSDFPFKAKKVIKYPHQAQFNPFLYVHNLANKIVSRECQIFQDSKVEKIDKQEKGGYIISTKSGSVSSGYLVHATHTPKGIDLKFDTTLGPYREYAIAAKLAKDNYPSGIFWEYKKDEKFSFRAYKRNGHHYIVAVGKSFKVGQSQHNKDLLESLEAYLKEKFPVKEVTHYWGGQNYKPADLLPFIGRKSPGANEYIATGFSTDGLVYGTLAGKIITDLITGNKNQYEDVFNPLRVNPVKSARAFTRENLNVAKEFFKDHILGSSTKELQKLKKGEGKIMEIEGKKLAISRDENMKYHVVSAYCTHLGCIIHWNDLEKSWDCPCHGSRFKPSGEVIEGPAIDALSKVDENNENG
ncbi:glycine/D-amino acid oxidase-like deaminating enzyme [Salegentibacter sp. 24]|uniref:FAD-dependent oxidoreductase n=1 Tax=Salegentibacter sp. 24 TaxID=2183986 RepID=UPI00105E5363|nr:FAD-dependent oxidoreductase [Salegentibacter sp. 24]TDN95012.1 glycine/D-amino acid oxidase-like deaminating enzyme [Salegentibacter sp. 24]